ncbi:sulfotransferase [Romeria aff. gracilis LEGE 07310]|uniref:Sulfotransferase n=1 Tax=Vasconcelosia minhoensis LEGE 07310 TaxID=915328 RepID=A0A8J7DF06_9CYAN|nr:sulfotransferase [Romeria gracilis]MBE9080258.1 sulfotransferase [Romeria aff. gracilis LEGE 07310]
MKKPNFLIIGTMKAGTTSISNYLCQHPQVYIPRKKELYFFAFEDKPPHYQGPGDDDAINQAAVTDWKTYCEYFEKAKTATAVGEASTPYLYLPRALERIQHYIPNVKLITILRNPIDRAYSSFLHTSMAGREPLTDFAQALSVENSRIQRNWAWTWHYKAMGFYHAQVQRYLEQFSPGQFRIYIYEQDILQNLTSTLADIYRFLEVDPSFNPDISTQYNKTGLPNSRQLHRQLMAQKSLPKQLVRAVLPMAFRKRLKQALWSWNFKKPGVETALRRQLAQEYQEDITKLQDLISRDLSDWLRVEE